MPYKIETQKILMTQKNSGFRRNFEVPQSTENIKILKQQESLSLRQFRILQTCGSYQNQLRRKQNKLEDRSKSKSKRNDHLIVKHTQLRKYPGLFREDRRLHRNARSPIFPLVQK